MSAVSHRLVAADQIGCLRVVDIPAGPKWDDATVTQRWGEPSRANGITALCAWSPSMQAGADALVAVGRADGALEVLDASTGALIGTCRAAAAPEEVAGVAFIGSTWQQQEQQQPEQQQQTGIPPSTSHPQPDLLAVSRSGRVSVHRCSEDAATGPNPWHEVASFQGPAKVLCVAVSDNGGSIAFGCDGTHLSIWRLATQQRLWQAKGGKPNRIGLVDLPHDSAVAFLPSDSSSGGDIGGGSTSTSDAAAAGDAGAVQQQHRVLVGTAQHKLLLYDTAAGRRPQRSLEWGEARVTALAAQPNSMHAWCANGEGLIECWDAAAGKMCNGVKGAGGSVRMLALHPGCSGDGASGGSSGSVEGPAGSAEAGPAGGVAPGELMASVGLDRFLRVHSTQHGRRMLAKVYLKQQLTGVAWLPPPMVVLAEPEAAADGGKTGADEGEQGAKGRQQRQRGQKQQRQRDGQRKISGGSTKRGAAAKGGLRHKKQKP